MQTNHDGPIRYEAVLRRVTSDPMGVVPTGSDVASPGSGVVSPGNGVASPGSGVVSPGSGVASTEP